MKSTAITNANIALIKYWGRRDDELVLPLNDSISFTMDDQLQTITSVEFDSTLKSDSLVLDGKIATEKELSRVVKFLDVVRKMAKKSVFAKVVSKNNFPKSAGLASSAAAFAALAGASSKAIGLNLSNEELSALARRGSGSASRSIHGGAVRWQMGKKDDGSDSFAIQLSPASKWPDLRNVIAITSSTEKKVGSAAGMKTSAQNSSLLSARLNGVGKRLEIVSSAIKEGNFEKMAQTIMQESNNMHAVMLDSWPPLVYMNRYSFEIIEKVLELNDSHGHPVAAYTFDAGPNAHIYTTSKYENEVKKLVNEIDGVEKTLVCKVGEGLRFSNNHLF